MSYVNQNMLLFMLYCYYVCMNKSVSLKDFSNPDYKWFNYITNDQSFIEKCHTFNSNE